MQNPGPPSDLLSRICISDKVLQVTCAHMNDGRALPSIPMPTLTDAQVKGGSTEVKTICTEAWVPAGQSLSLPESVSSLGPM